jgi:hypothetical protein
VAVSALRARPGAGEQCLAPEPMELRFKRRFPPLFRRLQLGGDRCERRFGLADRQSHIGLQRQQDMLERPQDRRRPALVELPAMRMAVISKQEQEEIFRLLSPEQIARLPYNWGYWGRPNQLPPPGDWRT